MAFPKFLAGFEHTFNGTSFKNRCNGVQLPPIKIKTEEYRGSGMDAPIDIDVGMEKLVTTHKIADITPEYFLAVGAGFAGGLAGSIVTGALKNPLGSTLIPCKAIMHGTITEIKFAEWKVGNLEASGIEVTHSLVRYSLSLANQPLANIDIENGIRVIGGKDYLDAVKAILQI